MWKSLYETNGKYYNLNTMKSQLTYYTQFIATAVQWSIGSGFWSPIRPDIWIFLDLDWISFSFQADSDSDYPNEIKSSRAKILVWNNSCIRKNYVHSKSYTKNLLVWYLSVDWNVSHRSGSWLSDWGHLKQDVVWNCVKTSMIDSIVLLWCSPSLFRWNRSILEKFLLVDHTELKCWYLSRHLQIIFSPLKEVHQFLSQRHSALA